MQLLSSFDRWLGGWGVFVYPLLFVWFIYGIRGSVLSWRFAHRAGQSPKDAYRPWWLYVIVVPFGPLLVAFIRWLEREYRMVEAKQATVPPDVAQAVGAVA